MSYASLHVTAESKDYGTPQTRQRGYLIAIHKERYPSLSRKEIAKFDKAGVPEELRVQHQLAKDLETWATIFTVEFRQNASVPAAFLVLRSDDPIRNSYTTESGQAAQARKAITWAKCKIGHEDYRDALDLGKGRKLTNWVNGGSYVTPDFYRKDTRGLVERTLDTLEIAHLRNLRRGFDDRYYR
jgi:site-specific DNA-cytosine methylase